MAEALVIAVAVANIVSGFGAGVQLFSQWRKKQRRLNQIARKESSEVECSLENSGPLVRQEYDQNFGKMGERFSKGDDIGRSQMQSHVITLQQCVIELLKSALEGRSTDLHLARLLATSEDVRIGSIRTLADQYQRMTQAASPLRSIRSSLSLRAPLTERARRNEEYCPAASTQQRTGSVPRAANLKCRSCKWAHKNFPPEGEKDYTDAVWPDTAGMKPWERTHVLRHSGFPHTGYKALQDEINRTISPKRVVRETVRSGLFRRKRDVCRTVRGNKWKLPHRFFAKSHLRIQVGVHEIDSEKSRVAVYGCLLCDRKDRVANFVDAHDLADHVEKEHTEDEYALEVDMERIGT